MQEDGLITAVVTKKINPQVLENLISTAKVSFKENGGMENFMAGENSFFYPSRKARNDKLSKLTVISETGSLMGLLSVFLTRVKSLWES